MPADIATVSCVVRGLAVGMLALLASCKTQPDPIIPWHTGTIQTKVIKAAPVEDLQLPRFTANTLLLSPEAAGDDFGAAMAMNAKLLVIGAPKASGGGAAWIFDPTDLAKAPTRLRAPKGIQSIGLGAAVAISPTGKYIAAGAPQSCVDDQIEAGRVYLWRRDPAQWTFIADFTQEPPLQGAHLGSTVAVNEHALLAGAPSVDVERNTVLKEKEISSVDDAFVPAKDDGETAPLDVVPQKENVSAATDTTAVIESDIAKPAHNWAQTKHLPLTGAGRLTQCEGVVVAWNRDASNNWRLTQTMLPDKHTANGFFGDALSLAEKEAVVGASGARASAGVRAGYVWIFEEQIGKWSSKPNVLLSGSKSEALDRFGWSVANTQGLVVVGAPAANLPHGTDSGRVYVFQMINQSTYSIDDPSLEKKPTGGWVQAAIIQSPCPLLSSNFGNAVALSGENLIVTAPRDVSEHALASGRVFVFERSRVENKNTYAWNPIGELCSTEPSENGLLGKNICASEEMVAISEPGARAAANRVHLFRRSTNGFGVVIVNAAVVFAQDSTEVSAGHTSSHAAQVAVEASKSPAQTSDSNAASASQKSP